MKKNDTEKSAILAIDQGTTSTRAIAFSLTGMPLAVAQRELRQIYPGDGLVEHDPEEIWTATLDVCRDVLAQVPEISAIGITNQRETSLLWDRRTGKPLHNAIVWQDRRGAEMCRQLRAEGHEPMLQEKTGLLADSYFSATKIAWLLENVPGARDKARRGELAFGTIDTFLLWRLTEGQAHRTDATNAARTLLFNLRLQEWDEDLCRLFDIPSTILPEIYDNAAPFGVARAALLGRDLPVTGMAGDQHAALIGQACFVPGMAKSTYGTGCFVLMNTGETPVRSRHRLLTTLAYRFGGRSVFALEGSVFVAGAAVQWLRDGLRLFSMAAETQELAAKREDNRGVYFVPAFTGLGAPYWDAEARGAIFGLTRDTGAAELVRAALEAVAYQTHDLIAAMTEDTAQPLARLRIDGGMARNDWLCQFLADILNVPLERPSFTETTAWGAAICAGIGAGLLGTPEEIGRGWQADRNFTPKLGEADRDGLLAGWHDAVERVRGHHSRG